MCIIIKEQKMSPTTVIESCDNVKYLDMVIGESTNCKVKY